MNTDKIYAETIANEYAIKDTRKVVQLKKLDAKLRFSLIRSELSGLLFSASVCAFL